MATEVVVSTPQQEILNSLVFQVYYRQLGMVSAHFGVKEVFEAAQALAQAGRGGTVTWAVQDRVFQWDGLMVTPGLSGSPTMSIWGVGSKQFEKNTAMVRKGWWTLYLPNVVGVASVVQTFRFGGSLLRRGRQETTT